ncbi:unnamed protein product [Rhizoctonia solani]|uniref:Uncharacterized protein n=1 Tax=Rhizoctonia solani TaxID=456999 RepID=A0A8H3HTU9_9AGAM|nr:unnamed protein product [Rhizoctonia solani]
MPGTMVWEEMPSPWPLVGYANLLAMAGRSSDTRSDSPFLDAYALSKLLWSDASSDEVDHILANPTMVTSTAVTDEDTDNPDENEVDGLIDTFEVDLPDRSLTRISSWLANVIRPEAFDLDFVNNRRVLSPLPTNRKRKSSSTNLKGQPALKAPKLMVDQPICPACNSTFSTKTKLLKHGRKPRTSEACREAISYAFE